MERRIPLRHEFLPVAVRNYTFERGLPQTVLLRRCDHCGKVRTELVNGEWTLAELTGDGSAVAPS